MIDIDGYTLSSIENGIILETKRCTADLFKVYIPRLMPKLPNSKINIRSVSPNKNRIVNKAFKVSGYKTQNFLEMENITSLNISDKGDVLKMSKVEGVSEVESKSKMPIKLVHKPKGGPPHPPHEHQLKKPLKFYDMVYSNTHDKKASKGMKVLVCFVGGNIYDARLLYIPNMLERGE